MSSLSINGIPSAVQSAELGIQRGLSGLGQLAVKRLELAPVEPGNIHADMRRLLPDVGALDLNEHLDSPAPQLLGRLQAARCRGEDGHAILQRHQATAVLATQGAILLDQLMPAAVAVD